MVQPSGRVEGAQQLGKRIKTIQEGLPRLVSKDELGAFLIRRMQARFSRREDQNGVRWKDRSPASSGNHPLLEKTGRLRRNIAVVGGVGGTSLGINTGAGFRIGVKDAKFVESTGSSSRVRNLADIARIHNRGNKTTPRRQFIGIGRLDIKAVDSLLRRKAARLIENAK